MIQSWRTCQLLQPLPKPTLYTPPPPPGYLRLLPPSRMMIYWYAKASAKAPTTGRLYHCLAILARPSLLLLGTAAFPSEPLLSSPDTSTPTLPSSPASTGSTSLDSKTPRLPTRYYTSHEVASRYAFILRAS
jgi:hypothetical protein